MDYSKMTDTEFDNILEDLVSEMSTGDLLSLGDVNMALREHLNNEVLSVWEEKQTFTLYADTVMGVRLSGDDDHLTETYNLGEDGRLVPYELLDENAFYDALGALEDGEYIKGVVSYGTYQDIDAEYGIHD